MGMELAGATPVRPFALKPKEQREAENEWLDKKESLFLSPVSVGISERGGIYI